jgi:hypothetical protein
LRQHGECTPMAVFLDRLKSVCRMGTTLEEGRDAHHGCAIRIQVGGVGERAATGPVRMIVCDIPVDSCVQNMLLVNGHVPSHTRIGMEISQNKILTLFRSSKRSRIVPVYTSITLGDDPWPLFLVNSTSRHSSQVIVELNRHSGVRTNMLKVG